ncbi:hypothetical protein COW49_02715 [Candidatus Kaiserbacteria bacterium CG17_big_fil_post_rev_8_21_14_2_50_51_7]|uniref:PD-(D/E)XK endonuclease-like domain-containing protein n=1 Tax=Candidatus Kaiserbacteria bacterium CG17_big_fil_post_rev_8_21_14_2_50_51_7 TaxID=1974613 RepID=A0A2M7FCD1_9BACT|nr:MAG: hypothetical protein COW49_02715 [Candidatus Kaiserbacteria bacterium CG17_big_fil_post_rev_8_21_14_2_50_51_7]PIX46125.1 MAG: hypothetical protein COZ56_00200 [Armatimonadetes bacterium CG_4_8_14_3_um_filter_58_9]
MPDVETKPHLSPSQLGMFFRCAEQYRRRYICGEKVPPGIALVIGSSVHKCVEADMRSKLETKELLKDKEIKSKAHDFATTELAGELFLTDDEQSDEKKLKKAVEKMVITLAVCHHKELAPKIEPNKVEEAVRLRLTNYPFDIEARLDLRDSLGVIHDLKTAGRSPSQQEADTNTGLTIYHWASSIIGPPHVDTVVLDALIKTKKPKIVTLNSTRSEEDYKVILRKAVQAWESIQKQVFTPCEPGHWLCNPKYCGYYPTCKYVSQTHRPKT